MGFRLYRTRLKILFRSREGVFWSYFFPIILASCFYFAFGNLWNASSFDTIKIGYVPDGVESDYLLEAINKAETSKGKHMFSATQYDKETAARLLKNKKIDAYIVGSTDFVLYVNKNGLNETIIKSFLDSYSQMKASVESILKKNPGAVNKGLIQDITHYNTYVNEVSNKKKPDAFLIYYFALFAMSSMFAANWGLEEVVNIQANQSTIGARMNTSPMNKMKLLLCNMTAAFTAHCGSLILLFIYMKYIIRINFGDKLVCIFITCVTGSIAGLMLGAVVGVTGKQKASVKSSILSSIIMTASFLSGLMVVDMKYIIAEKAPILAYINPVNLITDSLYSLYYYDTYERFILNIGILCIITISLGFVACLGLRRNTYASI